MRIQDVRAIIGREYVETEKFENEENDMVKDAFKKIKEVNRFLFSQIPYEVIFTSEDVYQTANEMRERVQKEGVIYIYSEFSGHPYLSQDENNIGRAVHDVFAHCVCGCPFTFQGELNGFLEQSKYYPPDVFGVLFAEIPAQTAAYYYQGDFSYRQRAFSAPEKWLELCQGLEKDYSENAILKPFERLYQSQKIMI